ncbi:MAG: type I phosphomannose isomerase catalytic subunit [Culicoidibacterales bacterium]
MEPIQFQPLYFEKVWGGRALAKFRQAVPSGLIGESWDIACHQNGMSIVANGKYKGLTFAQLLAKVDDELVGTHVSLTEFPLLLKIITAEENLSIQVHPGDEYAQRHEGQNGKTEAWYVLDATPTATLTIGIDQASGLKFRQALANEEDITPYLQTVSVVPGDCFLIPSGCVHAIGAGVTIIEIQQSSDVTYRLYDYGRPREIHREQGQAVTDTTIQVPNLRNQPISIYPEYETQLFCQNAYFGLERIGVKTSYTAKTQRTHFEIITCVASEVTLQADEFIARLQVGDSYLLPATLGEYTITGTGTILRSYPVIK